MSKLEETALRSLVSDNLGNSIGGGNTVPAPARATMNPPAFR